MRDRAIKTSIRKYLRFTSYTANLSTQISLVHMLILIFLRLLKYNTLNSQSIYLGKMCH